jgi:hypothetical protein
MLLSLQPCSGDYTRPLVGVEVESEYFNLMDQYDGLFSHGWNVHDDGSLRGEYPQEAVLLPCNGAVLEERLRYYEHLMDEEGEPEADYGWRCSTHVHLNLLYETPRTVQRLIPITLQADNFLFSKAESRRGNHNCYPVSLLRETLAGLALYHQALGELSTEKLVATRFEAIPEWQRYVGTNWVSLRKHGTLEFRHFPATNKTVTILGWVDLCEGLLLAAREHSTEQLCQLFEQDIEAWGQLVFPTAWESLKYSGWKRDYLRARDMVRTFTNMINGERSGFHRRLQKEYIVRGDG